MRYREIFERIDPLAVKPQYGREHIIDISTNPTRGDVFALVKKYPSDGPQLRGLAYRDIMVIWSAGQAVHHEVEQALERQDDFIDSDTPYEHYFQIRVEGQEIIFVGNPDAACHLRNFKRLFDKIDLMGGDEPTEYQPSQWGIPAREGGWSEYLG